MALSAGAVAGLIAGGTAIAGGITSAIAKRKALEAEADSVTRQIQFQQDQQDRMYQAGEDAKGYYEPYRQAGHTATQRILSGEFQSPTMGEFEYDRGVSEFLDPSMQYQQQQAQRALEESASAGGNLQSGNTLRALQNQAQDYGMQDYGNAYNRMTQDKSTAYQQYINNFNAQRQRVLDNYNQVNNIATQGFGASQGMANATMGQANQMQNSANNLSTLSGVQGDIGALSAGVNPQLAYDITKGVGNLASTGLAMYNQNQLDQQNQQPTASGEVVQQGSV